MASGHGHHHGRAGQDLQRAFHGRATIPAGWAMDSDGVPTTDTQAALAGLPMPLGGYKGSGLAMMAEILCAVLSGGAMSTELGGIRIQGQPMRTSQMFLAIDVARFMPLDEFARRMQSLVGMVKSSRAGQRVRGSAGGGRAGMAHRRAAPARWNPSIGGRVAESGAGRGEIGRRSARLECRDAGRETSRQL